jgi:hypothetical protein
MHEKHGKAVIHSLSAAKVHSSATATPANNWSGCWTGRGEESVHARATQHANACARAPADVHSSACMHISGASAGLMSGP